MNWPLFILLFLTPLVIGITLVITLDRGDSGHKLGWIVTVTFLPIAGIILYLIFGIDYRTAGLYKKQHRKFLELIESVPEEKKALLGGGAPAYAHVREQFRPLAMLHGYTTQLPPVGGNTYTTIISGQQKFDLLMADILAARESIHLEYYHFGVDSGSTLVMEALKQKAREGVKVRFINENIGNFPHPHKYYDQIQEAGGEVTRFSRLNPYTFLTRLNFRNHRKIVVIDSKIAYTGGMNLNNNYIYKWRDTHVRLEGPAVNQLQLIFMDTWITTGGHLDRPFQDYFPPQEKKEGGEVVQIVPDEPDVPIPILQYSYQWAFHNAKHSIILQNPYFAPPESVLEALKAASLRGVDVQMMVPAKVDTPLMGPMNRSYYKELLEAGIKLYERSGVFSHSKTMVVDGYLFCIGTANIDNRSFNINFEDNTYLFSEKAAAESLELFEKEKRELCKQVSQADVAAWPWYLRFWYYFVRLFALEF